MYHLSIPRASLLIIYKPFIWDHLDNEDTTLWSTQSILLNIIECYNRHYYRNITGKLYQELVLKSLKDKR